MSDEMLHHHTPSITVAELDAHIKLIAEKEAEIEKQKAILTEHNKQLAVLEGRCVEYLKELGRDNYAGPSGKVSIKQKWRVNMPVDDNAKRLLFTHLREREIFDKYATVNSNSLNALFMRDWEAAKEHGEGLTFTMPGIEAPTLFEALEYKEVKK